MKKVVAKEVIRNTKYGIITLRIIDSEMGDSECM